MGFFGLTLWGVSMIVSVVHLSEGRADLAALFIGWAILGKLIASDAKRDRQRREGA